jgi:methylphosphotriester-DNA--protein-cysteine methyltransferase
VSAPKVLCPVCQSRTADLPNCFYGRALAVHKAIRVCSRCDWVSFLPNDAPDDVLFHDQDPTASHRGLPALWARMTGRSRRREV